MHSIRYRIKALSPLVITAKSGDMNMVTTERFIPGTSVLGILASRFIMQAKDTSKDNAHENAEFYNWFLAGELKISNAYISSTEDYDEYLYCPVPFSIQKEKNDDIIHNLLYKDDEELGDIQTESVNKFCVPHFLYEDNVGNDDLKTKEVETEINFHHARDRNKGVSEEGKIFNYESVSPNQIFEGSISGKKTDLENLMSVCGKSWIAYAGRSRNAQYGKTAFELIDEEPRTWKLEIQQEKEISLTFLSDTILYNDNGFSIVTKDELEKHLGKNIRIRKAFIRKGDIETFVSKWRLGKPSEACFLAGSTFLLDISKCSEDDKNKLLEFQDTGIGERTHEGFGKCVFGWKPDKEMFEPKEEDDFSELDEPEFPMPQKAREILIALITISLKRQAEGMALSDLNDFERLPSNALIGRLEAMLKNKELIKNLSKLKKSAKNSLEHCNNKKKTLLEFLKGQNLTVTMLLAKTGNQNLETLCSEINYKPEEDKALENLNRIYFETFFSMMRKRAKKEKGD
ncbi:hypothetical protein QUF80_01460 [Desulfococcaceae bacterium HSG8]|nr:hypothetical protein [Desulfococcaceae bacterium HSG8]